MQLEFGMISAVHLLERSVFHWVYYIIPVGTRVVARHQLCVQGRLNHELKSFFTDMGLLSPSVLKYLSNLRLEPLEIG